MPRSTAAILARQASSHLPLTLTVQVTDTRRSVRLQTADPAAAWKRHPVRVAAVENSVDKVDN